MKFDYAIERDDGNFEVRFTDNTRYDIPVPLWRAIVDAGNSGELDYLTPLDEYLGQ